MSQSKERMVPPITVAADIMKMTFTATAKQLASLLRLARLPAHRPHAHRSGTWPRLKPLPREELVRIPAYLRRRRLTRRAVHQQSVCE